MTFYELYGRFKENKKTGQVYFYVAKEEAKGLPINVLVRLEVETLQPVKKRGVKRGN